MRKSAALTMSNCHMKGLLHGLISCTNAYFLSIPNGRQGSALTPELAPVTTTTFWTSPIVQTSVCERAEIFTRLQWIALNVGELSKGAIEHIALHLRWPSVVHYSRT